MVKFAKNGSDVTTAAVRLARAATGRDLVAFPVDQPFLSVDDWFIGATPLDAGIPDAVKRLSVRFTYDDLSSIEQLFERYPDQIACVIMEAATTDEPSPGFLEGVREITRREGTVLIFDETITGFRWHQAGAQTYYGVTPDLSTFGKAMGNGFSVAALVGRRALMELGGLSHDKPRVFLLSTTHGGETHALAAAAATIDEIVERRVTDHLWAVGSRLGNGLNGAAKEAGVDEVVRCAGLGCSPIMMFEAGELSAGLRTLFMQEMAVRGVLIPYIAPSFSHGFEEVDNSVEAAARAFQRVAQVLNGDRLERHLAGPPVRPVFRKFNADPR